MQVATQAASGEGLDDGLPIDDIAPLTLTLQLRKELGEHGFVQVRGAAFASDDAPGPSEVATPGYGIVDASAGYRLTQALELRFLARNLTNATYPASTDRLAVPAPGISGAVTAVVSFGAR